MNSTYISRHNEYRKAFPVISGRPYEFSIPAGTKKIYFALTLNGTAGKSGLRKFASRARCRLFLKSAVYAIVEVRIGSLVERTKVLLNGFSHDSFLLDDLWQDWFEIFVPVPLMQAATMQVSAFLADKAGRPLTGKMAQRAILLTEPVFLLEKKSKSVIFLTLESLSDMDYLLEQKFISAETYALYQTVFKDFQKVKDAVSQVDWTFPAVSSYHTGLLPSQHRMYNSDRIKSKLDRLDSRIVTLADLLKQRGYITFSASLDKLKPENGFANGIDCYFKSSASMGHGGYTGDDTWVIKKLQQFKQNCFIHVHYDRLHAPLFSTTGPWSRVRLDEHPRLDEKGNLEHPERYYDANLQLLLHEVHNIIMYLKLHNMFDDTLMIVTGDHGTDIGEWTAMRQENPFIDSRSKLPYLINASSKITTRNATLRPFFEVCDLFGIDLPDYFRMLPQADKELGRYAYSETFLKSKNHLYVLNISDEHYKYMLYAHVEMSNFSIKTVEKEQVIQLADQMLVQDADIVARWVNIRKRFFEMNQNFVRQFYASKS